MKRFLIAASVIALSAPMPLHAQVAPVTAKVVGTCGTMSYVNGSAQPVTQDTTGTLCTAGGGGGGGGNVNLTGINGVAPSVGAGATGSGSLRTTQAQDTSTIAGSAPGTAGTPSANVVTVQGASGGTPTPASLANGADIVQGTLTDAATCASGNTQMSCLRQLHTDLTGAIPAQSSDGVKIGAVQGTVASGSTADTYPVQVGGRAATAAPTAVTDGQIVRQQYTPEGRVVIAPYSIKELMVRGTATSTDTSAHTIIASAGGSLKNYITAAQCGRTDAGTSALTITFNDSASTVIILPAGGATNITFPTPLATAAATAFQFTSGTGVTTLYCSAQGYTGL